MLNFNAHTILLFLVRLFFFFIFGFFLVIPKHGECAENEYPESLDGKVIVTYLL